MEGRRERDVFSSRGSTALTVLTDPCKPVLPLLAKSTWEPFTAIKKICITATFTASFPATFIAFPHRSCCCWRFCYWCWTFSCWCSLLKAGLSVAAGIFAVSNIPAGKEKCSHREAQQHCWQYSIDCVLSTPPPPQPQPPIHSPLPTHNNRGSWKRRR